MTRKDYIRIAEAIRAAAEMPNMHRGTVLSLAASVAETLASDNPRFEAKRFFDACGIH